MLRANCLNVNEMLKRQVLEVCSNSVVPTNKYDSEFKFKTIKKLLLIFDVGCFSIILCLFYLFYSVNMKNVIVDTTCLLKCILLLKKARYYIYKCIKISNTPTKKIKQLFPLALSPVISFCSDKPNISST